MPAAALAAALLPFAAGAALRPLSPAEGDVVGPRLYFRVDAPDLDERSRAREPLRIALLDADGVAFEVWERLRSPSGWALGAGDEIVFTPRRPLPDGDYRWRIDRWDGAAWVTGDEVRFRVDSVPPAPVEEVRLSLDRGAGVVVAEWRPVAADALGGAEFVARYRVYAAAPPAALRPSADAEIAATDQTRVELPLDRLAADAPLVGIRVQAQDAAGNETGRRH